jgi:hypothetical protein
MSRMSSSRKNKSPRHVRVYHHMLRSDAWQSLCANARAIYIEISARYAGTNNGRIPYSCREAAKALGIGQATAIRAIWKLEDRGFIVATKKGAFSLKLKHATEWRLTEFSCDITNDFATKDFMRWRPETAPVARPKIQNTGIVVKPSASVVKPYGSCGETDVA